MNGERHTDEFAIHPVSSREERLRVTATDGSVVVLRTSCSAAGWGLFYAIVIEPHERELEVEPIDRRVTYHRVKAREVLGVWRKSRAQNGRVVEALRTAS